MKIRASIVIPTHNNEHSIKKTLESCIRQTEENIEILVVDNGSTVSDGTESIVKSFSDNRIHYYKINISNRSIARNYGINKANGQYIQFLDADDVLQQNKIFLSCNFLDSHNYFAYMTLIEYRTSDEKYIRTSKKLEKNLTAHNTIPINAILMRNNRLIPFNEQVVRCEDWLFWVENLKNQKIYFNKEYVGGTVYISGNNTMSNRELMLIGEIEVRYLIKKKFRNETRTLFNFQYALFGFIQLELFRTASSEYKKTARKHIFMVVLAKIAIHVPFLSKKIKIKMNHIEKANPY